MLVINEIISTITIGDSVVIWEAMMVNDVVKNMVLAKNQVEERRENNANLNLPQVQIYSFK